MHYILQDKDVQLLAELKAFMARAVERGEHPDVDDLIHDGNESYVAMTQHGESLPAMEGDSPGSVSYTHLTLPTKRIV